jgi:hypothetical protein
MSEEEKTGTELTIFGFGEAERVKALQTLISGKTPVEVVKSRKGRGTDNQQYVNTYYMTRQANLITGWRWTSKTLEESARPDWTDPIEVGAHIEVTIWNKLGEKFSHDAWGQKDVSRYENLQYKRDKNGQVVKDTSGKEVIVHKAGDIIALFDDRKAAISDGIKKGLSYFGIADDIYGGKEPELYLEEAEGEGSEKKEGSLQPTSASQAQQRFVKYLRSAGISPSQAFKMLGVKGLGEITDYKAAEQKLADALAKPKKEEVIPDREPHDVEDIPIEPRPSKLV